MSVVIAVCVADYGVYGVMVADSRLVIFDEGLKNIKTANENFDKILVMNDSVCIGISGDAYTTTSVADNLPKAESYHVDNYVDMILSKRTAMEQFLRNDIPTNFTIMGLDKEKRMTIKTLSSKDDFKVEALYPTGNDVRAIKISLPFGDEKARMRYKELIHRVATSSNTTNELEHGLTSVIYEIEKNDKTVNNKVKLQRIYKSRM
jgi:hypothetical protein